MPADRGTTALVAACFRAGAVLAASITQRWQHCLQAGRAEVRSGYGHRTGAGPLVRKGPVALVSWSLLPFSHVLPSSHKKGGLVSLSSENSRRRDVALRGVFVGAVTAWRTRTGARSSGRQRDAG
jgi:hypothetical protein